MNNTENKTIYSPTIFGLYSKVAKDTYYRDRGVFDSKHDAVLSNNAKNEFGSDVAIVFDPKNNVNFLGSKAD